MLEMPRSLSECNNLLVLGMSMILVSHLNQVMISLVFYPNTDISYSLAEHRLIISKNNCYLFHKKVT